MSVQYIGDKELTYNIYKELWQIKKEVLKLNRKKAKDKHKGFSEETNW